MLKQREQLHCQRCGHDWFPLVEEPVVCPRCKSYNWREPREEKDGERDI